MTPKEILNRTKHGPWKLPTKNWKFYQEWNHAIFLHWEVELGELQKFVPKELEIDLFDGKPWVSLVAFTMQRIRPRNLPHFTPISDFAEINIRTYVKSGGKTGVYFLSIEGGKLISCKISRRISKLPYRYSKIVREPHLYRSENPEFKDNLSLEFVTGKEVKEKSRLDKWLTERYALFQDTENSINKFEIHHLEWPVKELKIANLELDYPRFRKLINRKPDKIQYSNGVQVNAWGKEATDKNTYHN